jgi:hypothetical protein
MSDIISWDKAIGKKVRSNDDKDLGKVESITREYIQTKEGMISKSRYFIPKYHLSGYDGDKLWVSLTKDEVRAKFERESAPELSEWETAEYSERRTAVTQRHPDFATNIPAYKPTSSSGMVQLSWDKIIGKKVRSSDKKDLGDVESVATDYIEVKEGIVSRKHYYIPKYYIQGFDGDNLYTSLTKDEIKARFERDSPPSTSELQTPEYQEHVRQVESANPQFVHGVPWMAKEPSTEMSVDYSGTMYNNNIPWDQLIHKHARTTDNVEIGYVERIGNEFIVVREGVSDVHIYYIPKTYIRDYDGSQLWIDAPSGLVRSKFEKETEPPLEELRAMAVEAPRYRRAKAQEQQEQQHKEEGETDTVTVETDVDLERGTTKTTEGT